MDMNYGSHADGSLTPVGTIAATRSFPVAPGRGAPVYYQASAR